VRPGAAPTEGKRMMRRMTMTLTGAGSGLVAPPPLSQDPVTEAFPESQSWTNGKGEVRGGGGILQIKTRRGASALTGGAASAEERWRLHGSVEEMAKGETSNERRLKGLFGLRVAWNRVAPFQFFRTEPLRSAFER
jgi:hypothetical protein